MAHIQKRKNKDGTFSYRVQIRNNDGHPPQSKTVPTFQEAKDWAVDEEARRRNSVYNPEDREKHSLEELIDRYLTIVLPTKPKNTRAMTRQLVWWKKKLGKYHVKLITPNLIAQCRQELAEGITAKKSKRSPATVNRYLAALSIVMTYGVRECGWLTDNPCSRVTKFKESKGRDRVASQEECLNILESCKQSRNPHLLPIVLIAMTTGMRQGEITGLTWENLDLERGVINLKETKNGRPRSVALVGEVLNLMRERFLSRAQHTPFVFPALKRFGKISIRGAWEGALKRAKVEGLRFHDLRHTFATYAAESGASHLELAAAMGHQSLQMLLRYTHINLSATQRLSSEVHHRILEENGKVEASKAG
jgi:integrase